MDWLQVQKLARPDLIWGAVDWQPPELMVGGCPSVKSDSWALGVVVYKLVTGKKLLSIKRKTDQPSQKLVSEEDLP